MASASCRNLLDLLEHNGQSGRSGGMTAVFVSLSFTRTTDDEPDAIAVRLDAQTLRARSVRACSSVG